MIRTMIIVLGSICMTLSAPDSHAEETAPHSQAFVVRGVMLNQGNNSRISRFTEWLARQAELQLSIRYADSYQSLSSILREQPDALAWTCGVPFVEDQISDGQQLVAVPLFRGKPVYHSLVVTSSGRQEKSLSDFRGQVFAYSDPRSNSGYIAPAYALKQDGIDIKRHFRYLMHTGLHEYSIEAVLAGQADVANIDEYVVVEYFKVHPESQKRLAIIERFGPYPFTPVVAGKGVAKELVARLQRVLTEMHDDKEGAEILAELDLDGFVSREVAFYQPIAAMLHHLKQ